MKKQIRRNVFETNSSSVHSLTMCTSEEFKKWENGDVLYWGEYSKFATKEEIIDELKMKTCYNGEKMYSDKQLKEHKMNLLGIYKNGNYTTKIFDNGTKIRETEDDEFIPAFAENLDIKITNNCDMNCPYCHEGSTFKGRHGDFSNAKFIDTLHPYQEVAIGGGDATSHPDLIPFLQKLKDKKVIANLTVNQTHFEQKQDLIKWLVKEKLIYGLGVSLVNPTEKFIELIRQYPNAVIHTINGVLKPFDIEALVGKNLKLLILGYKHLRRGDSWYQQNSEQVIKNQQWLKENLPNILKRFNVVSFDNLAIEQLNVKTLLSESEWEEFYMGDDGTMTFYIDLVERKFARSSTADFDKRYDLLDSVDDMFQKIVEET